VDKKTLTQRLDYYSRQTAIKWLKRNRFEEWKSLGLPDLRGFTPHLRAINLYSGQTAESQSWLLHDLLHILFYDFVALHLGVESWLQEERFLENHLASEAFAVLALDYHVLSSDPDHETLTVDVTAPDWKGFQQIKKDLPPMTSRKWCELLVTHYLTGEFNKPSKISGPYAKKFNTWIGHEIRYARKQRAYVRLWLDDLNGAAALSQTVEVHGSHVDEAVWDLLQLLLYSSDRDWKAYISEVKPAVLEIKNVFDQYPKYNAARNDFDFRLTDIDSFSSQELKSFIRKFKEPSSSGLFFIWQVLQSHPISKFEEHEIDLIRSTALASQSNSISQSDWNNLVAVAEKRLPATEENTLRRSTFLLS
jgi:hypothetical protein